MYQGNDQPPTSESVDFRRAFGQGYVTGVLANLDGRGHAFIVEAVDDSTDTYQWLCRCGWMTFQYAPGSEQTPIETRLIEHMRAATAVDQRTAKAFEVDGCSCPPEIGEDHRHELYFRTLASTGQLAEIVVDATWCGGRVETLCWPLSHRGAVLAGRWVDKHPAHWRHAGSPVAAEDLIRQARRWY